jgi:hypothetical protein
MSERAAFLDTLKQILRLTREHKIAWQRINRPRRNGATSPPAYRGRYQELEFRLRPDAVSTAAPSDPFGDETEDLAGFAYTLHIRDHADGSVVVSPPMEAVTDVARVIQRRLASHGEKLHRINERLAQS